MPDPLVSVLIPVFNRERLVGDCIQSALEQTEQDLEVVVVDNASTDATWEVCRDYASRDTRVRCFRNDTNVGPVRNWARCFQEARGRFGKVLFSDDLMAPSFLEKALPFIQDQQVGFVFTAVEIGPQPGQGHVTNRYTPGVSDSQAFIQQSLFWNRLPVSPGAALFRMVDLRANLTTDIQSPSFDDFANHGAGPDLLLYLLTAHQYPSVAHIPEPLSFFRSHEGSISVANDGVLGARYLQAKLWFTEQHGDRALLERMLARYWLLELKTRRRWISPRRFGSMYVNQSPAPIPGAASVVDALTYLIRDRATRT